jgi:hypothetical protein
MIVNWTTFTWDLISCHAHHGHFIDFPAKVLKVRPQFNMSTYYSHYYSLASVPSALHLPQLSLRAHLQPCCTDQTCPLQLNLFNLSYIGQCHSLAILDSLTKHLTNSGKQICFVFAILLTAVLLAWRLRCEKTTQRLMLRFRFTLQKCR